MAGNNTIQRRTQEAVAKGGESRPTIQQYVKQMMPAIKAALPSVMTPERFTRITLSALSSAPKLQECTPTSFLGAMMTAAQLGVEPNTPLGQAYLIPYKRNFKEGGQWQSVMECQFQLGYKGLIDLAYRSGEVSTIMAQVVYEKDEFSYSFGLEPTLKHVPAMKDRGAAVYVYAMFKTKDGGYGYEVMSIDDVRNHAQKFSKSYGNGPWQTNFEEMAKKTVLKRVLKYAPLKSEFLRAVAQDEAIKNEISEDMYEVQGTYPEADYDVNPETGEVIQKGADKADPPPDPPLREDAEGQQKLG